MFCKQCIKWLGHVLTEEGIQLDPGHIKPLVEWETPQRIGDVRSLHGLLGTMRNSIKNFADKTKNIWKHLKPKDPDVNNKKLKKNKNQLIQWDKESQEELNHMKNTQCYVGYQIGLNLCGCIPKSRGCVKLIFHKSLLSMWPKG